MQLQVVVECENIASLLDLLQLFGTRDAHCSLPIKHNVHGDSKGRWWGGL